MMGEKFPCMGCDSRKVGCHSTCEQYKAAAEKHRKVMAARDTKSEVDYCDFKVKTIEATKKRYR